MSRLSVEDSATQRSIGLKRNKKAPSTKSRRLQLYCAKFMYQLMPFKKTGDLHKKFCEVHRAEA